MSTILPREDNLDCVSPVFQKILSYINPDQGWDFIIKPNTENGQWTTQKYYLDRRTIQKYWLDPELILGLRFKKLAKYLIIDIDKLSEYLNATCILQITSALKQIGLNQFIALRSSDSEGIHLMFTLPKSVNSFDLACAVTRALYQQQFKIANGTLEIFPNTKSYAQQGQPPSLFKGVRLPLQPKTGSCLLDPDTLEPTEGGLKRLAELMDVSAQKQDLKKLEEVLKTSRKWYVKHFQKTATDRFNLVKYWEADEWHKLEAGFTKTGQTNDLLLILGKIGRVFRGYEDVWQMARFIESEIVKLPGYSQYCGHQHEIDIRAFDVARSAMRRYVPYRNYPQENRIGYQNILTELDRRIFRGKYSQINQKRYDKACSDLIEIVDRWPLVTMPKQEGKRRAFINQKRQQLFGKVFSYNTLRKPGYIEKWHPKYDSTNIAPEKAPNSTRSAVFNIPLQLLSCRAIARHLANTVIDRSIARSITTKELQPQVQLNKSIEDSIAPTQSSMCLNLLSKDAVIETTKSLWQCDRTLMKGFVAGSPYIAYKVDLLISLVKKKLLDEVRQLLSFDRGWLTSAEKLVIIQEAKRNKNNEYFYLGSTLNCHALPLSKLKRLTEEEKANYFLSLGTKVKIISDLHSSTLSDDNRPILVYVRPFRARSSKPFSVPLNSLVSIGNHQFYWESVGAEIKSLCTILGLTKEDYHEYLQSNYGLNKTRNLSSSQLLATIRHFENLLFSTTLTLNDARS